MSRELLDLDHTIKELKTKISHDPDPFILDILNRLVTIRENQQTVMVERVNRKERKLADGGFRGYGVT